MDIAIFSAILFVLALPLCEPKSYYNAGRSDVFWNALHGFEYVAYMYSTDSPIHYIDYNVTTQNYSIWLNKNINKMSFSKLREFHNTEKQLCLPTARHDEKIVRVVCMMACEKDIAVELRTTIYTNRVNAELYFSKSEKWYNAMTKRCDDPRIKSAISERRSTTFHVSRGHRKGIDLGTIFRSKTEPIDRWKSTRIFSRLFLNRKFSTTPFTDFTETPPMVTSTAMPRTTTTLSENTEPRLPENPIKPGSDSGNSTILVILAILAILVVVVIVVFGVLYYRRKKLSKTPIEDTSSHLSNPEEKRVFLE